MKESQKAQELIEKYYKEQLSNSNYLVHTFYNSLMNWYNVWVLDDYFKRVEGVLLVDDEVFDKIKKYYKDKKK